MKKNLPFVVSLFVILLVLVQAGGGREKCDYSKPAYLWGTISINPNREIREFCSEKDEDLVNQLAEDAVAKVNEKFGSNFQLAQNEDAQRLRGRQLASSGICYGEKYMWAFGINSFGCRRRLQETPENMVWVSCPTAVRFFESYFEDLIKEAFENGKALSGPCYRHISLTQFAKSWDFNAFAEEEN